MLFFYNPGLIELDAVRTMGASVKQAGSFGMFGTGLKYGLATILRGGGEVSLYRGADRHTFGVEERFIRGEPFQLVTLDGEPMGFTTALGRNWKPWMVLREFGCNARDEHGDFASTDEGRGLADFQSVDQTVFAVQWDDLEAAYKQRADLFVEGEPIYQDEHIRILPGASSFLFYRGVRVYELEKPAKYRYDLLDEQMLTEDRTLYGDWNASLLIRNAMLKMDDTATLGEVLCAGSNYYENGLNYEEAARYQQPSRAFLDTSIAAREGGDGRLNDSAKRVLLKHIRSVSEEEYSGGYRRVQNDRFSYAVELLESLGVEFDEKVEFVTVDELPGEALSMVENGRVYVLNNLTHSVGAREIALELLKRWVDLKGLFMPEEIAVTLGALLIDQHADVKRHLRLVAEDAGEPVEEEADA